METKVEAIPSQADQKLQQEFNQWAAAGRGDEMEDHHSNIMDQTLSLMDLQPADRVLDLGCGTGWASRRMARLAGEVVGLDVADEMLRRAEQASASITNVRYVWGSAEKILLFALDERVESPSARAVRSGNTRPCWQNMASAMSRHGAFPTVAPVQRPILENGSSIPQSCGTSRGLRRSC